MGRWYDSVDNKSSNIVYSRIRLARNWDEYTFPSRMTREQCGEMLERMKDGLKDLGSLDGKEYRYGQLDEMQDLEKLALRERRILNLSAVNKKEPAGLFLSEDEGSSLVLGGDDHIRMQFLASGLKLDELWHQADVMDDYVNERFSYAFDEKYGYLTSFPTNVGTGLRACVVLHLPTLSQVRKFQSIVGDMSRFGTAIRGLYGEGSDNYGSLYEISNQRTLGQSEREIVELVTKAAAQLNNQEMRVRNATLNTQRLEREDEAYKSYGVLKYARKISEKDARIFISQLMAGEEDGLMKLDKKYSLYSLVIGIKPANLNLWAKRPLDKDEMDAVRAAYLRQNLPEIADK